MQILRKLVFSLLCELNIVWGLIWKHTVLGVRGGLALFSCLWLDTYLLFTLGFIYKIQGSKDDFPRHFSSLWASPFLTVWFQNVQSESFYIPFSPSFFFLIQNTASDRDIFKSPGQSPDFFPHHLNLVLRNHNGLIPEN